MKRRTATPPDNRSTRYGALIRGRRARPGKPCPDCLRDRVRELDSRAVRLADGGVAPVAAVRLAFDWLRRDLKTEGVAP